MTWVATKLELERMAPGDALEVRCNAGEALENVPRSAREDVDLAVQAAEDARKGWAGAPIAKRAAVDRDVGGILLEHALGEHVLPPKGLSRN